VEKVSFEPGMNSECVMDGKNHKQILSRTKTRNGQPFWLSFAPVLRNESSRERKFQGANVPHLELSLLGANGLGSEKSSYRRVSMGYSHPPEGKSPRVAKFFGTTYI